MNSLLVVVLLCTLGVINAGPSFNFGANGFGHGLNHKGFHGFNGHNHPFANWLWGHMDLDDDDDDDFDFNPWGGWNFGQFGGWNPYAQVAAPQLTNFGHLLPAPAAPAATAALNPASNTVPYGADYVSPDGRWPAYNGLGLFNRYGAFLGKKK